jgi:hypothetical protein
MRFKKFCFILFIVIATSCSQPLYNCLWQAKPVIADGNASEWPVPLSYFDGESKLQYSFSNDINNIYACVKVADAQAQLKIMRGGMQLSIDTTGKNKKQVCILFPTGNSEAASNEEKEGHHKPDPASLKRNFLNQPAEMLLTGFKHPLGGLTSIHSPDGVNVSINWDSTNTMVYEAVIPFKKFYKKEILSLDDSTKVFGISLTVNGLHAPKSSANAGNTPGASGMPSARGMTGAGMGGAGGMQGGGGHSSNPLYESHTIKSQLQLSTAAKKPRAGVGVW